MKTPAQLFRDLISENLYVRRIYMDHLPSFLPFGVFLLDDLLDFFELIFLIFRVRIFGG